MMSILIQQLEKVSMQITDSETSIEITLEGDNGRQKMRACAGEL